MIREYGGEQLDSISELPAFLRAMVGQGPRAFMDNAQVEMRVLMVDEQLIPIVIANPEADNSYVCSPYSHYVRYTREELIKRNPGKPAWLFKAMFAAWTILVRKRWLDRSVYVNNWLLSTNPMVELSPVQLEDITRFLHGKYPGCAIIFRSINSRLDERFAETLTSAGYRLVPARRVYLLPPSRHDRMGRRSDLRREVRFLENSGIILNGLEGRGRDDAVRLTSLYRGLYLHKHSWLNQQFNQQFFKLATNCGYFEGILLSEEGRIDGMVLFHTEGDRMLAQVVGYNLCRSRQDGLYRQVVIALILEARSRGLMLNLSAGSGKFKSFRGGIATLEWDAVLTAGLPWNQRLAWRLIESQGWLWTRFSRKRPAAWKKIADWRSEVENYVCDGKQQLWRRCSDDLYVRILDRLMAPVRPIRLLKTDLWDEASGTGLRPYLETCAEMVIGMDISSATARLAQKIQPDSPVIIGDVRRLPIANDSFDAIISNSTLDHFETEDELLVALAELARVLKPGGQLIISLDNPRNPIIRLRGMIPIRWLIRWGVVPYFVGATLSAGRLSKVLEQNDLHVEQLEAVVHCPRVLMVGLAAVLQRWAPKSWQDRFVEFQHCFEGLGRWPTRFLTGHYTILRAVKVPPE